MLTVIIMGTWSLYLPLSAAFTSWVGSGTSDGTTCATLIVEAGPAGTACDEEMS